jgi:hypothetical protein
MHALLLALAALGQYPSSQSLYSAPPPPPPPVTYAAPVYAAPVQYAAPQLVTLGAGQVIQPGPFGMALGRLGQRLEKHAWPRMQPMQAAPMAAAPVVYLAVAPPQYQVMQATYAVQAPQTTYAAPPPQTPAKAPPTPYGSPQGPPQGLYGAARPSEAAPPAPGR